MIIALLFLIIPFAIVGFWQKRSVIALIVATILSYLLLILPGLIQTFQALMVYGSGDSELMAGGISRTLISSGLALFVVLPLLFAFQRLMRHLRQRRLQKQTAKDFE